MKKIELAMFIGLIVSIFLGSTATFARDCETIAQNTVRLHILANSDSVEDQQNKLLVRDAILENTTRLFEDAETQEEAREVATRNLPLAKEIAEEALAAAGCTDTVQVELVNMFFETRHYDGFDLPAGRYDALRITIGEGAGQNWWCMVFPPMCITAAQPDATIDLQEQVLHLGETPAYEPKLAIVEFFKSLEEKNKD